MAHVNVHAPDIALDEPMLVDGLPGVGLIGKVVADHLVAEFEMEYYASVHCEGIPLMAAYRAEDSSARSPVQLYAAPEADLLTMVSDIPVSGTDAPEFADCITDWFVDNDVTPIYLSGLDGAVEPETGSRGRELYGLSTAGGDALLDEAGIVPPRHAGVVTGPTGALIHRATEVGLDSVGLLVESDDGLPDIDAAQVVIERGIEPLTGLDVDTSRFVDGTVEMSPVAEAALDRLGNSDDGTTSAQPTPTFY